MTDQEMILLQNRYDSLRFRRKYTYQGGDLGVRCREGRTAFALWAPLAVHVTLRLYDSAAAGTPLREISMQRCDRGVWRHRENQSLHGTYYDYLLEYPGETAVSGDPYATACGCNSGRCMAADLSKLCPEGWEEDRAPAKEAEDIIWETHIKEFSWLPCGGFPAPVRGKYLAFTCPHTTLNGDSIHPTGLDYLKELGVNTLQLMPFFDYGSVDERDPEQFNWGYDPVYYNIPEGSYASDPENPCARILECRKMIQALHKAGFRVVMDVVYNHTLSLNSPFTLTAPGYYYRHDSQGHACNGSLCGNEVASQRPMCARFILDSVLFWAEAYHVDGFRFDLMGLLDTDLMNRIRKALDQRYGVGEKLVYGEPWFGRTPVLPKKVYSASKSNMGRLDRNIAMFCDNTRDSVKGNVFYSAQPGFVGGAENLEHSILHSIHGWTNTLPGVTAPSQIISYLSCHDNLTLFDKLRASGPPDRDLMAMYRLCAAVLMTCQGHIFLLSGEEFGRTKNGNDNSYNAPISLNALNWQLAYDNFPLRTYYQGLIGLRKHCPGLCEKSEAPRLLSHWAAPSTLGVSLDNSGPEGFSLLYMIYNAGTTPITQELSEGIWEICADGENSFLWQEHRAVEGSVTVPPVSALILRKVG